MDRSIRTHEELREQAKPPDEKRCAPRRTGPGAQRMVLSFCDYVRSEVPVLYASRNVHYNRLNSLRKRCKACHRGHKNHVAITMSYTCCSQLTAHIINMLLTTNSTPGTATARLTTRRGHSWHKQHRPSHTSRTWYDLHAPRNVTTLCRAAWYERAWTH